MDATVRVSLSGEQIVQLFMLHLNAFPLPGSWGNIVAVALLL